MLIDASVLKNEEKVILELRRLYRGFGYSCYKMSKFEEYDLYVRNKEFLVSDSVITFTDTNGKLMALKPDVTLSIVKNTRSKPGCVQRLYYNENVYRISDRTHSYREIMQTGLECIGDIDHYHLCEVMRLAALSLEAISGESVLNVAHLGVLSAVLETVDFGEEKPQLLKCIGDKNVQGVAALCDKYQIPEEAKTLLTALPAAYGRPEEVICRLRAITKNRSVLAALEELETVLCQCGALPQVRLCVDFSLIQDMNYYNGLVFRGYVKDIPSSVLRGGQYDRLMAKLGKDAKAVGFAVYLDLLERLEQADAYDTDVLLLYQKGTSPSVVLQRLQALAGEGKRVTVQAELPEKLTYRTLERLDGREGG